MQRIIIGTAGHVDHGKSTLVKALTGVDPDRLPEEKERGMTIDLGFVFLPIDGDEVAIIDVPGHERFIKTMIAGATSIRLVLFVVAADEGVMPQTREHLDILKLLGVAQGIIVLTKIDKVSKEESELAAEDVRLLVKGSFLENAPLLRVSPTTRQGLEDVKQAIETVVRDLAPLSDQGIFRTPIDRVFSIKGFGTIVAGTVISGRLKRSESVEVLPIKKTSRLRGMQVHNQPVDEVFTGQRVAFNLADLNTAELDKGYELSLPGYYEPTSRIFIELLLLHSTPRPLTSGTRVRLHKGTCEVMARVTILDQEKIAPGGHGLVMLRLESPIIAVRNERCLVRTYSPMTLIGSGTILEAYPEQYQRTRQETIEYLNALRQPGASRIEQLIRYRAVPLREEKELMKAANLSLYETKQHLAKLMTDGTVLRLKDGSLVHRLTYARIRESFVELLRILHDHMPTMHFLPITAVTRQEKSLPPVLLDKIIADMTGEGIIERRENCVRFAGHTVSLPAEFLDQMNRVEHWAILTGYKTLTLDKTAAAFPDLAPDAVKKAITYLVDTGQMVEIAPGVYIPNATLKAAEQVLRVYLKEKKQIRASDFKDLIAVSRETARAMLDHFLRRGITIRIHGTHTLADQWPNGTVKKTQHP